MKVERIEAFQIRRAPSDPRARRPAGLGLEMVESEVASRRVEVA